MSYEMFCGLSDYLVTMPVPRLTDMWQVTCVCYKERRMSSGNVWAKMAMGPYKGSLK